MSLDSIRRTIQRAFERLNAPVGAGLRRTVNPRTRDSGIDIDTSQAARLKPAGFSEEALPWMNAVYRFALRLTREDDAAQDLVQETYLRAYRAWDSYERGTNCRSWLFTICRNTFLHGRERGSSRFEIAATQIDADIESMAMRGVFENAGSAAAEPDAFFGGMLDERVVAAIDRLPEEYREALVLSDLADLTYPEIEQVLAIPRGTVKSRLFRARRLLHNALLEYAHETGYLPRKAE